MAPEACDVGGVVGGVRELAEPVGERFLLCLDQGEAVETEPFGEGELEEQGAADVA
jgi:hypothetical protein